MYKYRFVRAVAVIAGLSATAGIEPAQQLQKLKSQFCFSGILTDQRTSGIGQGTNSRWISLGGTPERRCLCVPFYLCDAINTANDTNIQCSREQDVCCLRPRIENPKSIVLEDSCTCVSSDKCYFNDILMPYGIQRVQFNQTACAPFETCCPNEFLSAANPAAVRSQSLISSTDPPSTNTSECNCVPLTSCNISQMGIKPVRSAVCEMPEICCPFDYIIRIPNSVQMPSPDVCGMRKDTSICFTPNEDPTKTYFGEFPWMVMILKLVRNRENEFICGGSLISTKIVLTAAHCVTDISKDSLLVRAGDYDSRITYDLEPYPHQERHVIKIRIHPFYLPSVLFNDIAILVLDEPFELAFNVAPICIPYRFFSSKLASPTVYDENRCIVAGWGKNETGIRQPILKKADVSIVNPEQCEKKLKETQLGERFRLHYGFICAQGERGKDICEGYGGGPLFCALRENPQRYVQVGIVSWDIECSGQYPGVYSNLYANSKWLALEFTISSLFS